MFVRGKYLKSEIKIFKTKKNSDPLPEFRSEIHLLQHSIEKVPVNPVKRFSLSRLIIAKGRFLALQYSIRSLIRYRFEKIDLPGTPQVWSSCRTEDKTLCNQAARALVLIL